MRLRNFFLGNWRNKVVALFFATTIWFVAYQYETDTYTGPFTLQIVPENNEEMVILRTQHRDQRRRLRDFDGQLRVTFSGPRKRIDRLRQQTVRLLTLKIGTDEESHTFTEADFETLPADVTITGFEPARVRIQQEKLGFREIQNLQENVAVTEIPKGYEVKNVQISQPQVLRFRGPESLLDKVNVSLPVPVGYQRTDLFQGNFVIEATAEDAEDAELVRRTVSFFDFESQTWSPAAAFPRVRVTVFLGEREESFSLNGVKLTFRLPITKGFMQVSLVDEEATSDRIPLKFSGPKEEIENLRAVSKGGDFSVGVPPPPLGDFDEKKGGIFTFQEENLELHGFPGIRVLQHDSLKNKKIQWTYRVRVVTEEEAKSG